MFQRQIIFDYFQVADTRAFARLLVSEPLPEFVSRLDEVIIVEEVSRAILSVEVSTMGATVQWLAEGKVICHTKDNGRIQAVATANMRSLIIDDVRIGTDEVR